MLGKLPRHKDRSLEMEANMWVGEGQFMLVLRQEAQQAPVLLWPELLHLLPKGNPSGIHDHLVVAHMG
jgi:hypothetical protein